MPSPDPALELREPLPAEGVEVPLRASFLGIAGVPLLALGENSLSPRLRLFPDEIECKVFRARRRTYEQIRRVGAMTSWATRNVELVWRDSAISFTANVRDDAWRLAVLRLFAARGAALSHAAQELLQAR